MVTALSDPGSLMGTNDPCINAKKTPQRTHKRTLIEINCNVEYHIWRQQRNFTTRATGTSHQCSSDCTRHLVSTLGIKGLKQRLSYVASCMLLITTGFCTDTSFLWLMPMHANANVPFSKLFFIALTQILRCNNILAQFPLRPAVDTHFTCHDAPLWIWRVWLLAVWLTRSADL